MALNKIWVLVDRAGDKVAPVSVELLSKASQLASTVEGFTWGDAAPLAADAGAHGAGALYSVGDLGGGLPGPAVGAAVAAQPVTDTIKESADGRLVARTLDRSKLWAVQTPQTFRVEVIRQALSEVRRRGLSVTDDTAACELIGQPVELVVRPEPNPKVTRPEDLPYIELLLRRSL